MESLSVLGNLCVQESVCCSGSGRLPSVLLLRPPRSSERSDEGEGETFYWLVSASLC